MNVLCPSPVVNQNFKYCDPKDIFFKYRFETLCDISFKSSELILPIGNKIVYRDKHGNPLLTLKAYEMIVHKGYQWDGCTPKYCIFGLWFGAPDFKATIFASLAHDALLQFHKKDDFPLSRRDCDDIFKAILRKEDFVFTSLYSFGVDIGSLLFD